MAWTIFQNPDPTEFSIIFDRAIADSKFADDLRFLIDEDKDLYVWYGPLIHERATYEVRLDNGGKPIIVAGLLDLETNKISGTFDGIEFEFRKLNSEKKDLAKKLFKKYPKINVK